MKKLPWWQQRTSKLVAIGVAFAALTQIGNGWKAIKYLADTPDTAYAAKAKAEKVDTEFSDYLKEQRLYTEALNKVVTQQQQMQQQQAPNQAVPQPWTFLREEGDWQVFEDPNGVVTCCNGSACHERKKKC